MNRDQPYAFMIHPNTLQAFNQNVFDPATIVTVNQQVQVRVVSVDLPRRRIALSLKQA